MLGCWADGMHAECRFCGSGVFKGIACPNSTANETKSANEAVSYDAASLSRAFMRNRSLVLARDIEEDIVEDGESWTSGADAVTSSSIVPTLLGLFAINLAQR